VPLTGVVAEVSHDGGTTWTTCPTGVPRTSTADPIVCTFPQRPRTTAVTSMDFVVREDPSSTATATN
jgi:hypothetical protein